MRVPGWAALLVVGAAACQRAPEPPKRGDDPERCATCHMDEFRSAKNPMHVGQKPDACGVCHTQNSWHPSVLDHPWPLTGAHATKATCFECHSNPPKFKGTSKQCIACHRPDYTNAPNHVAQKFPTKCEQCHLTTSWSDWVPGAPSAPTVPATAPAKPPAAPTTSASGAKGKPSPTGPKPKPAPTPTTPPDVTSHPSPRR